MADKDIIEQDLRARKARLDKSTNDFKRAVSNSIEDIKGNVRKWGTVALVVGGTIFVTYKVIKAIAGSNKNNDNQNPGNYPTHAGGQESTIVSLIKQQIAIFLFALAKKKLLDVLKNYEIIDEENQDL
jgi:type I site-specific restriction-modification system R (restriction) subunit